VSRDGFVPLKVSRMMTESLLAKGLTRAGAA
jgi:hypothetical protein